MKQLRAGLLRGGALIVLSVLGSGAAMAQTATTPEAGDVAVQGGEAPAAEIVVTGSRISRAGFSAPTPTTVIDARQFEAAATPTIADYVNQLPSLVGSQTPRAGLPTAGPTIGAQYFNLRSLGINRTLVLLDGHRVAPSTLTGNVDAGLLPQALVKQIDVVTGGASAAWGSDAVAGVVNFVLDKDFTGIKANIQGGVAEQGDFRTFKAELSLGAKFADGRGHILVSGEFHDDGAGDLITTRDWYKRAAVINNPAWTSTNGQPRRIVATNTGYSLA
ncbi:MAG: TonB-dependent receptor plug domain-containing protein, partial [Sphingomonadales bacterium]|nr:TonB-dependent receptor plug domain-containing protein [Sphingomonadales bacterium]